jgi:mono/diheme cytochrome c family protein
MKRLFFASLILAGVACTSQLYIPGEKNVDKVEKATLAELQQGHDLYVSNCGNCHKLYKPSSQSNVGWKKILNSMAPKAKLNNDQSYLIYRYLVNR